MMRRALVLANGEFSMAGTWRMAVEWDGPAGKGLVLFRGNVPAVAFGPKNAQWTALAILAVSLPALAALSWKGRPGSGGRRHPGGFDRVGHGRSP